MAIELSKAERVTFPMTKELFRKLLRYNIRDEAAISLPALDLDKCYDAYCNLITDPDSICENWDHGGIANNKQRAAFSKEMLSEGIAVLALVEQISGRTLLGFSRWTIHNPGDPSNAFDNGYKGKIKGLYHVEVNMKDVFKIIESLQFGFGKLQQAEVMARVGEETQRF